MNYPRIEVFETASPGKLLMELVLFCKALPLSRPRVGYGGQVYQPLDNQALMRSELHPYKTEKPITQNFWLSVHAFYESQNKGDLDNIVKGVADNLQFVGIIHDDRQMKGLTATIEESCEDYTLIRINEVINVYPAGLPN